MGLETLPRHLFRGLDALTHVDLRGNPFHCDCRIKWLVEWLSSTNASAELGECQGPAELNGTRLSQLQLQDFDCITTALALFQSLPFQALSVEPFWYQGEQHVAITQPFAGRCSLLEWDHLDGAFRAPLPSDQPPAPLDPYPPWAAPLTPAPPQARRLWPASRWWWRGGCWWCWRSWPGVPMCGAGRRPRGASCGCRSWARSASASPTPWPASGWTATGSWPWLTAPRRAPPRSSAGAGAASTLTRPCTPGTATPTWSSWSSPAGPASSWPAAPSAPLSTSGAGPAAPSYATQISLTWTTSTPLSTSACVGTSTSV
uniref:LRRCT domain-containing protein n=1 Tax=Terrapene triunguis TaxID=2587831 RepID=A0A674K3J0_9SAUR